MNCRERRGPGWHDDRVPHVEKVIPILNVRDVEASLQYYAAGSEIHFCLNGQGNPGTWLGSAS